MFYSITEQLNHAARHRNVYFDTVGGDPYGEILVFLSCWTLKDERIIYSHLATIKTRYQPMSCYNVMVVQQIYVFQGQNLLIKACSLWQCKHKQATDPSAIGKPAVKCSITDNMPS